MTEKACLISSDGKRKGRRASDIDLSGFLKNYSNKLDTGCFEHRGILNQNFCLAQIYSVC